MQKNILITGKPRSGKSTLLQKLINVIPNKVGFITKEILENNERVGFEIETHLGKKNVLAHINFKTPNAVSRYFVNVENLEAMIPEVVDFQNDNFLYLDEIGQMELFSAKFKELVLKYLNSENICLAIISNVFEDDFIKSIKAREDVIVIEISEENRDEQEKFVTQLIRKIEKAKKYILEPQRFSITNSKVELKSEHATRTLVLIDKKWECDCDFFREHQICSHTIATKEFIEKLK